MARIACKRCHTSKELKQGPFEYYDSWMKQHMKECWKKDEHPRGHFSLDATEWERNREDISTDSRGIHGPRKGNPKRK